MDISTPRGSLELRVLVVKLGQRFIDWVFGVFQLQDVLERAPAVAADVMKGQPPIVHPLNHEWP
jgi:hypothetical protein